MDIDSVEPDDLKTLIKLAREGELTAAETERLGQILLNSSQARRAYIESMSLVAELRSHLKNRDASPVSKNAGLTTHRQLESSPPVSSEPFSQRSFSSSSASSGKPNSGSVNPSLLGLPFADKARAKTTTDHHHSRRWKGLLSWSLVCLGIIVVATGIWSTSVQHGGNQTAVGVGEDVAQIRTMNFCQWGGQSSGMQIGAALQTDQQFELITGTVKLHFHSGATAVIEGPSAFELLSTSSMRLHSGTVVVRANGPVKDFVVETPDASIIDLGTSFGVHFTEGEHTEVEVFEGAVEVATSNHKLTTNQVFNLGANARVREDGSQIFASEDDRFGNLLEWLWEDLRDPFSSDLESNAEGAVVANFEDGAVPDRVDTFRGSTRGRGWLTPWVASGNPVEQIRTDSPLSLENPNYLFLQFENSFDRTLGREYGSIPGFDALKPHVITWKWRFDGQSPEFGETFRDRIHFYGNPHYRRSSWPENSWLIGVVGDHEKINDMRQVYPGNWFLFDGTNGSVFHKDNMVDTGMKLKRGVTYCFAVIVYPDEGIYDVMIRDDEITYTKTGLTFRNGNDAPSTVLHFGVCTDKAHTDTSFSLDSIRVEQLPDFLPDSPFINLPRTARNAN